MRFPKLSALALAASLASSAFAGTVFNGYAITTTGTGNTYYYTDTPSANPSWLGKIFSLQQGSSLWLGGQVETSPGAGAVDGFESVMMNFRIDSGTPQSLNLDFARNIGSDDQWETLPTAAGAVDIGALLSAGMHTITVSFLAIDNNGGSGTVQLNNSGAGWTSNIDVLAAPIPEPSSAALILAGLGLLSAMAKRRRAKR